MAKALTLPTTERRRLSLAAAGVTIRDAAADAAPGFSGYAAKFNERAAIGNPLTWGFYEQVADGAFTKTLSEGDARFLVDHDTRLVVSRTSADTLRLAQDKTGLATDSDLDTELTYVRDLVANLRNGNITGMSFGFEVKKDSWETVQVAETDDGDPVEAELRTLLEIKLYEVSAVTFPAYESTEAKLRSVATALVHRGDDDAIARHAERKPELLRYTQIDGREPGKSTRGGDDMEPGKSTPSSAVQIGLAMRKLAATYGLPANK